MDNFMIETDKLIGTVNLYITYAEKFLKNHDYSALKDQTNPLLSDAAEALVNIGKADMIYRILYSDGHMDVKKKLLEIESMKRAVNGILISSVAAKKREG